MSGDEFISLYQHIHPESLLIIVKSTLLLFHCLSYRAGFTKNVFLSWVHEGISLILIGGRVPKFQHHQDKESDYTCQTPELASTGNDYLGVVRNLEPRKYRYLPIWAWEGVYFDDLRARSRIQYPNGH